jgi:small subunit ribosomal protein S8
MPVSDPIGDLLTRMRNAQHTRQDVCRCPWSRHKEEICQLLKSKGFLSAVTVSGEGKEKEIVIEFSADYPRLTLTRVSKPGRRVYAGSDELKSVLRGFGLSVVTTSEGLMTGDEARKKKMGGEVLCTVS